MNQANSPLHIKAVFNPADMAYIRTSGVPMPNFWQGHQSDPETGDWLRFGERQYQVGQRAWEMADDGPVLCLYMHPGTPLSEPQAA
jgi:hypothetical protein